MSAEKNVTELKKPSISERMRKKVKDRIEAGKSTNTKVHDYNKEEPIVQVDQWIPLGEEYFERASGGKGFPCGHITQLIGKTDSGKTTLLMEGLVSCQKQGGVAYILEPEHKFDFGRFEKMGGNPEDLIYIEINSLEDAWNFMLQLAKDAKELRDEGENIPIMVAWDSVPTTVPNKILEEDDSGNAHIAVEAKINNKNIRKLRQAIKSTNIACVFINHFYYTQPKTRFEQPELVLKGGEEMGFLSTLIIMMKQGKKITRDITKEIDGKKKKITQKLGRFCKIHVHKGHFHGRTIDEEVAVVETGILEYADDLTEYKKSLRGKI